jgi:hypothetical protein
VGRILQKSDLPRSPFLDQLRHFYPEKLSSFFLGEKAWNSPGHDTTDVAARKVAN